MMRAISLLAAVFLSACSAETLGPQTEVYVLVDLSETWNNEANLGRNTNLFRELTNALVLVSDEQEPPFAVQVRAIGSQSLEREPLCNVVYRPTWSPIENDDPDVVTNPQSLRNYLTINCPQKLLRAPQEPLTEISASIQSIANLGSTSAQRRYLIILSDFLEESSIPFTIEGRPLSAFDVIMIYRPLSEDQRRPAELRARVEAWRDQLQSYGAASVIAVPDTGLRRERIADEMNSRPAS